MMMENKNVRPWQQYQALYLHIPFCVQKCLYCDFASYAGFGEQAKRDYTDAVCKEIALRAAEAANMAEDASIYFGGGIYRQAGECIEAVRLLAAALRGNY